LIGLAAHICYRREESQIMKLPKLTAPIRFAVAAMAAVLLTGYGTAGAVILNCPQTISLKAAGAPYPWTDSSNVDATLGFAEASYSCSNGTCTLSCAYSMQSSIYTFLAYKVAPGVCHYTNQGHSFACSSLPPPRLHHRQP
jgi:hypothetical protein